MVYTTGTRVDEYLPVQPKIIPYCEDLCRQNNLLHLDCTGNNQIYYTLWGNILLYTYFVHYPSNHGNGNNTYRMNH